MENIHHGKNRSFYVPSRTHECDPRTRVRVYARLVFGGCGSGGRSLV